MPRGPRAIGQVMKELVGVYEHDGRLGFGNILDHEKLYHIGFNVFPIGKPALTHFEAE